MGFTYETMASHANLVYEIEKEENIDTVTLGMITNNQIEGIIRPTLSQRNVSKYLKYNVTGKMSMKDYVQKVQKNVLLTILGSILEIFESAQEYMIDEKSFVLDRDYIFIDFNTHKASLISIPEEGGVKSQELELFLKDLLFSSSFDEEENGDYVITLFNYLNSNTAFSVKEFRSLIQDLRSDKAATSSVVQQQKPVQERTKVEKVNNIPPAYKPPVVEPPVYVPEPQIKNTPVQPQPEIYMEADEQEEKKSKFGFLKREKKVKEKPEKKVKEKPEKKVKEKKKGSLNLGFDVPGKETLTSSIPIQPPTPEVAVMQGEPSVQSQQYVNHIPNTNTMETRDIGIVGTVELTPQSFSGTVELNPTGCNSVSSDYLHRLRTNGRFFMSSAVSRVGSRSDLEVYITQNPAVSSLHASIYKRNGIYFIKDENSKNHTYVDGIQVNSGEERQINNRTNIRLADEEFVFYIS